MVTDSLAPDVRGYGERHHPPSRGGPCGRAAYAIGRGAHDTREPAGPLPDQTSPEVVSATGQPASTPGTVRAQSGAFLTTAQGLRLKDTDHSLKAGERGPTLLEDHHLREKITHFDHERIPERVVHARGAGAHGIFRGYGSATSVCRAGLFGRDVLSHLLMRLVRTLNAASIWAESTQPGCVHRRRIDAPPPRSARGG